jgi:hypothetical protein
MLRFELEPVYKFEPQHLGERMMNELSGDFLSVEAWAYGIPFLKMSVDSI